MNHRELKRQRVENWIISNKTFLHFKAIERETGIPENTIQKFSKAGTTISARRITRIYKWLKTLISKSDEVWIIENKKYLNITAIEIHIEVRKGTVQKFIKYGRKLDKYVIESLEKWQCKLLEPIHSWKTES